MGVVEPRCEGRFLAKDEFGNFYWILKIAMYERDGTRSPSGSKLETEGGELVDYVKKGIYDVQREADENSIRVTCNEPDAP